MPFDIDPAEHMRRKKATAVDFTIKKDDKGNVLNPEVVSVTVQDKKDSQDINRIMKKVEAAKLKGELFMPSSMKPEGRFGDFTNAPDYQEAQNRVIRMRDLFMSLPADVRFRFENDPIKMIEFLDKAKVDPATKEEGIKLGIFPKPTYKTVREDTPQGNFWVTLKDGVEIGREPIKTTAPAPGA